MKNLVPLLAIIFGFTVTAGAKPPAPLPSVAAIRHLSYAESSRGLPAAFQATVTYFRSDESTLFVMDEGIPLYIHATTGVKLAPGDRILVRGKTRGSFRPDVTSSDITFLHHGAIPKPATVTFDQAIHGDTDCLLVTLRGVIRSVDVGNALGTPLPYSNMQVLTNSGYISVTINGGDTEALQNLLDSEVELTGVVSGKFDGKMQQTGVLMHVSGLNDLRVIRRVGTSPWQLPITPMEEILQSARAKDLSQRVRVQGTITYFQPGSLVVLQSGSKSLQILSETHEPLAIGDWADATGFPDVRDGFLALTRAEIRDTHQRAPVVPLPATWRKLASSGNIFDLTSIEGTILMEAREATQDEYVLVSEGHLFNAIYRHANAARQLSLAAMKQIAIGSKIRVTGICINEDSNPFNGPVPFIILLRSPADIAVVAHPSLLNVTNLALIVGLLIAVLVAVVARAWIVERRARQKTTELAALESRRSRILEDINGTRPLSQIIEQITEWVSLKLQSIPCWCKVADGTLLGNCCEGSGSFRILKEEIPARCGPALGTLFAAADLLSRPNADETEALSMGAGLATLAIETRNLNAELRHRSEFDLLTDIRNRFSLEKHLEARIEGAQSGSRIFGLIYIDLDKFKQVNDLFGHHAGDLYLQQAAWRMKRQLRPGDLLARIGGDEFAALVSVDNERAEVEEIAERLVRCFEEPFTVEGSILCGSISVGIALYPADGVTKDSLLSCADAGMYLAKRMRNSARSSSRLPEQLEEKQEEQRA